MQADSAEGSALIMPQSCLLENGEVYYCACIGVVVDNFLSAASYDAMLRREEYTANATSRRKGCPHRAPFE